MTLSKSSSEMSVTESYSGEEPALLTRMSTRPNRSYAASTSASSSAQCPVWTPNGRACRPVSSVISLAYLAHR